MTVVRLATEKSVNHAWETYRRLCVAVRENGELRGNPEFMARVKRAEADWVDLFNTWNRRAA